MADGTTNQQQQHEGGDGDTSYDHVGKKKSYPQPAAPSTRLPLHPRRAQELFFELTQTMAPALLASHGTDHTTQTLHQRITAMQCEYGAALQQLKRGYWLRTRSSSRHHEPRDDDDDACDGQLIHVRLSQDGAATLQLSQFKATPPSATTAGCEETVAEQQDEVEEESEELELLEQVALAAITSIELAADDCVFTLRIADEDEEDGAMCSRRILQCPLEAESDLVLRQFALALSTTLSSLKNHSQKKQSISKTDQLLGQAIRLRVTELSAWMPLRDAGLTMQKTYNTIQQRETEIELPNYAALCALGCSVSDHAVGFHDT